MKVLTLLAGVLAACALLAACGGGKGGKSSETPVPTLPGDQGEIVRVLNEFVDLRSNGTAAQLAALFSTTCTDQAKTAQSIINAWKPFKEGFVVKVNGLAVQDLQADSAKVKATGVFLVQGDKVPKVLASPLIDMKKEDGAWKIATCSFELPGIG